MVPMTSERATKKQQELLLFVKTFLAEHDYSPSYREIMTALGYKSVSTVAVHLDALIAKGYLRRSGNAARSLEVADASLGTPAQKTPKTSDDIIKKLDSLIDAYTETDDTRKPIETLLAALEIVGRAPDAAAARQRFTTQRGL